MDNTSFKALSIVLYEEHNKYISEYIENTEYMKNIINNLLNSDSLLSKIIQIVRLENSYDFNEYTLNKDCLEFYNISYNYDEIIKLIPLLNNIGVHIIQYNYADYENYGEIYYMNWENTLHSNKIKQAKKNKETVFMANRKFNFKFKK